MLTDFGAGTLCDAKIWGGARLPRWVTMDSAATERSVHCAFSQDESEEATQRAAAQPVESEVRGSPFLSVDCISRRMFRERPGTSQEPTDRGGMSPVSSPPR